MSSPKYDYQAYYCEENIWRLLFHPSLAPFPKKVVFISNPSKMVPMWMMRGVEDGQPIVWDYHVILLVNSGHWAVWDLDHQGSVDQELSSYLDITFEPVQDAFQPLFRVVDAVTFREHFSSDRSHMLTPDGKWQAPPPSWPAPRAEPTNNLMSWISMTRTYYGEVMDLPGCCWSGMILCHQ